MFGWTWLSWESQFQEIKKHVRTSEDNNYTVLYQNVRIMSKKYVNISGWVNDIVYHISTLLVINCNVWMDLSHQMTIITTTISLKIIFSNFDLTYYTENIYCWCSISFNFFLKLERADALPKSPGKQFEVLIDL